MFEMIKEVGEEIGLKKRMRRESLGDCFGSDVVEGGGKVGGIECMVGDESIGRSEIYREVEGSGLGEEMLEEEGRNMKRL